MKEARERLRKRDETEENGGGGGKQWRLGKASPQL